MAGPVLPEVEVERDPESRLAVAGRVGDLRWKVAPDGMSAVRHDGEPLTPDELRTISVGIDPTGGAPAEDVDVDAIDLGQGATWLRPDRERLFARLRAERPVSRHVGMPFSPGAPDVAWWAVSRYDDVEHVSRHPEVFSSGEGGTNITDIPPMFAEFLGSIINMDAPRHTKLRRLISAGFTPRQVGQIEGAVRDRARRIVDDIAEVGSCEVVEHLAAPLPLGVICDMMGIPPEDEHRMFELSNTILGFGDPEYVSTIADLVSAGYELQQYGIRLAEARRSDPRDDITTALVHAEVDGESLTTEEIGSFFVLLVAAGNETTRTATSHGLWALTRFPDQRERWLADLDGVGPTAVEEIVRWASPVLHFRRTVMADTTLGDVALAEGDRVVMLYLSANRDEGHFTAPDAFDVTRSPNDHVGFGGGGPHFCLGANLARRELRVIFDEVLRRLPDLRIVDEPDRLSSAFINGIKRMHAEFTPAPRSDAV